jgi:hypothetical protein
MNRLQRPCKRYQRVIYLRATDDEKRHVFAMAKEARVSASRYLIRLATDGRAPPPETIREELRSLRYLLAMAGSNLNQIAHRINRSRYTGEKYPPVEQVIAVIRGVERVSSEIKRRL